MAHPLTEDTIRKVILGDNLDVLASVPDESVDLVYIDPPFNTGRVQTRKSIRAVRDEIGGDRVGFKGNRYRTVESGLHPATPTASTTTSDSWSLDSAKPNECSSQAARSSSTWTTGKCTTARSSLDGLFGRDSFMNEIIWAYDYGGRSKSRWSAKHDSILWYAKDANDYTFHYDEMDRIPYMAPGLVGPEKAARGKTPTDVWWHTIVSTAGKEKTGYPTQKPLGIIKRIVSVHSSPGDLLLDFFAGSGTLGEAAALLDRSFILIDNNEEAVRVMAKRLAPYGTEFENCGDD